MTTLNNINEVYITMNTNTNNVERYDLIGIAIKNINPDGNHVSYANYKALQNKAKANEVELNRQISNYRIIKECYYKQHARYTKLEIKYDIALVILWLEALSGAIYIFNRYLF